MGITQSTPAQVTQQCADQVPKIGGSFEAFNSGLSGEIKLEDYPNHANCQHVVYADSSCKVIEIRHRSIAVEPEENCDNDSFRLGWTSPEGVEYGQPICYCYGNGCESNTMYNEYIHSGVNVENFDNYFGDYSDNIDGTEVTTVIGNEFTFYFKSNYHTSGGHVILDWKCVELATTTQAGTTLPSPTTTTIYTESASATVEIK